MNFLHAFDRFVKYDKCELILDNTQIIIIREKEIYALIVCVTNKNKRFARISSVIGWL